MISRSEGLSYTLAEVYYPRSHKRDKLVESYLLDSGHLQGSLILEKKGAFKNILADAGQAALSTGAIAVTGGAGGDIVVDVIFAAKIAKSVLAEVASMLKAAGELGAIIIQAAKLDFDGSQAFEKKVQSLLARTVKNQLVGDKAKEFIADASKRINEILEKIARAIGKWVGALIPDDFGLGGIAFEALFERALKESGENIYKIVVAGINALPLGAGKYLTDSEALEDLLEVIANSMIDFIDDTTEWAESQRAELEEESFSDMVGRKASSSIAARGAIGSSIKSAAGSGFAKLTKLQQAPGAALFKVMDKISGGRLEASTDKQRTALVKALQNKDVDERIVSQVDNFYQKYGNPLKVQDTLDQLEADQQEKFKAGVADYINSVKQANKGEILFMSDNALPAVRDFLVKFRNDWIPTTVAVMRKLMSWLMAGLVIFQELINPEKYLNMKRKLSPFELEMEDTFKDLDKEIKLSPRDLAAHKLLRGNVIMERSKSNKNRIRLILHEVLNEDNKTIKITKKQLQKIVAEEVVSNEYKEIKEDIPEVLDSESPEEIEAQPESWAGGQNIHHQIDHSVAAGGEAVTRGVESLKITESQIRNLIRESLVTESIAQARRDLLDREFERIDSSTKYPYGRNRGDVRSNSSYTRKDGKPVSEEDMRILSAVEEHNHPLGGMYTHSVSEDGMTLNISYYKHTAG